MPEHGFSGRSVSPDNCSCGWPGRPRGAGTARAPGALSRALRPRPSRSKQTLSAGHSSGATVIQVEPKLRPPSSPAPNHRRAGLRARPCPWPCERSSAPPHRHSAPPHRHSAPPHRPPPGRTPAGHACVMIETPCAPRIQEVLRRGTSPEGERAAGRALAPAPPRANMHDRAASQTCPPALPLAHAGP
jgi:hypothetical protein